MNSHGNAQPTAQQITRRSPSVVTTATATDWLRARQRWHQLNDGDGLALLRRLLECAVAVQPAEVVQVVAQDVHRVDRDRQDAWRQMEDDARRLSETLAWMVCRQAHGVFMTCIDI